MNENYKYCSRMAQQLRIYMGFWASPCISISSRVGNHTRGHVVLFMGFWFPWEDWYLIMRGNFLSYGFRICDTGILIPHTKLYYENLIPRWGLLLKYEERSIQKNGYIDSPSELQGFCSRTRNCIMKNVNWLQVHVDHIVNQNHC